MTHTIAESREILQTRIRAFGNAANPAVQAPPTPGGPDDQPGAALLQVYDRARSAGHPDIFGIRRDLAWRTGGPGMRTSPAAGAPRSAFEPR